MKKQPLVSVLVLNWNGAKFLDACIESLLKTRYAPLEIVVVDNCSADASVALLEKYPSVKTFVNERNLGYAAGNNAGFARCNGKYIVTLNNDMKVDPDWLHAPVAALERDPSIGLVGCRQMSWHEPAIIDGLYHILRGDLTFYPFGTGCRPQDDPRFLREGYVLSVNGGSSVIRKRMLDEIGGFDERFFAYYDEVDLCMKAFVNGWSAYYTPDAVVYHLGSASFKKDGIFTYFLRERNRMRVMYKYFPWGLMVRHLLPLLVMELRVIRVMALKSRRPDEYFRCRREGIASLRDYRLLRKNNLALLRKRMTEFSILRRCGILTSEEIAEYRKQPLC